MKKDLKLTEISKSEMNNTKGGGIFDEPVNPICDCPVYNHGNDYASMIIFESNYSGFDTEVM